tara:strand:- start:2859 stop:3191 length:333 start_codon:yes stop_codon:yes gene_type:complete
MDNVFFRKLNINKNTGSATLIVTDKPLVVKKQSIAGLNVGTRGQNNITFGVLSLIDPETNKVMRSDHPTIKQLQSKLNGGDPLPGFRLSDNPVIDQQTGEETSLKWVESV